MDEPQTCVHLLINSNFNKMSLFWASGVQQFRPPKVIVFFTSSHLIWVEVFGEKNKCRGRIRVIHGERETLSLSRL
jgi:hypothetical protein